jgi:rod shape-determining protein MreD
MRTSLILAIPLMFILAVVQAAVLPIFPIMGMAPSLSFLVAIAWGLLRGAYEGALWAFVAGFFQDLGSIAPFGGAALTFMAAVFVVSWIKQRLPPNQLFVPFLLAVLALLIQNLLYLIFLAIFGWSAGLSNLAPIAPAILAQALLVLPIYWLLRFVDRLVRPKVVQI